MSTDFEQHVSAALHRAADQVPSPSFDLDLIRRGGRRRRIAAFTAAPLTAVVVAAAVVIGVLQLPAAPAPSTTSIRPARSATHSPAPAQAESAAIANLRAFYGGYMAAQQGGQAALNTFIGGHVASWYAPMFDGPSTGFPPSCTAGVPVPDETTASQIDGQVIIVLSLPNGPGQDVYEVVTADQGTGMITGFACPINNRQVTAAAASDATSALYSSWLTLRRQGESAQQAVAHILGRGPGFESSPYPYLYLLQDVAPWQKLTYDPLLCTSAGLPDVSVTAASVVAGGLAGVVALTPGTGQPIVAVVVQGDRGLTIVDVACHQP